MISVTPEPEPRYQALLKLLKTAETLWEASRVFFAKWDLSPSQFNVLNLLHGKPSGCSQVQLSRDLIMHRSNVTGLVDRLEARGLLTRRKDPKDRRAHRVILTTKGMELLQDILPKYGQAAKEVWREFPLEHADRLLADLERISSSARRIADADVNPNLS